MRQEESKIYRALSSDVRREILELLLTYGQMDLKEISEKTNLKEITVRHHLSILEQSGLIESFEVSRGAPGRPRRYYRVVNKFWNLSIPKRQYELLSRFLLENIIEKEGREAAKALMRRIGEKMGRELIQRVKLESGVDKWSFEEVVRYVIPLLEEMGSIPRVREVNDNKITVEMYNCIFYEVARAFPGVVCEGHKALFRVIGEAIGDCVVEMKSCMAEGGKTCITELKKKGTRLS